MESTNKRVISALYKLLEREKIVLIKRNTNPLEDTFIVRELWDKHIEPKILELKKIKKR